MIWTTEERTAWTPPAKLKPSEWAEQFRVVSGGSHKPGKWSNDTAPYMTGILDLFVNPNVEEIVLLKAAQIGYSEMLRTLVGFIACEQPGDMLFVMPSEASARELMQEKIRPLLEDTPAVAAHVAKHKDAITQDRIHFDNCNLYIGWSGSPQALASRTIRYLFVDECDKFPPFSGREADPISLAKKRLTAFEDRARTFIGSTPTTQEGAVAKAHEACLSKLAFYLPCPHCNTHQVLTFGQVKWPKIEGLTKQQLANRVMLDSSAYYECQYCKAKIYDNDKPKMLREGKWFPPNSDIDSATGLPIAQKVKSKKVGIHVDSMSAKWISFSKMAAEFLEAAGDIGKSMDFRNSRLALPFEQQVAKVKGDDIRTKAASATIDTTLGLPRVPAWTGRIYAAADHQIGERFFYVVRAFGHNMRSQLLAYGEATSFQDLREKTLGANFPTADGKAHVAPHVLVVDSGGTGDMTQNVYDFVTTNPAQIIACKGASHRINGGKFTQFKAIGEDKQRHLLLIDTGHFKSVLSAMIREEGDRWQVVKNVSDGYIKHMSSERLVFDRKKNQNVWVADDKSNHWWDCEVYALALADFEGVGMKTAPEGAPLTASTEAPAKKETPQTHTAPTGYFNSHMGKY